MCWGWEEMWAGRLILILVHIFEAGKVDEINYQGQWVKQAWGTELSLYSSQDQGYHHISLFLWVCLWVCVCGGVRRCTYDMVCLWKSEDNSWESLPSCYLMRAGDWPQVIRHFTRSMTILISKYISYFPCCSNRIPDQSIKKKGFVFVQCAGKPTVVGRSWRQVCVTDGSTAFTAREQDVANAHGGSMLSFLCRDLRLTECGCPHLGGYSHVPEPNLENPSSWQII